MQRLLLACLIIAIAAAGGAWWFARAVNGPGPLMAPATVIVAPGAGLSAIGHQLADAGIVRAPWLFVLEARRSGRARALKPGEYRFAENISLNEALAKIARHDVVLRFVTVAEGLTTAAALHIVAAAEGLDGDMPAVVDEGALMPETYRYEWGDKHAAMVARMTAARADMLAAAWAARAPDLPLATPQDALILASIVEKETGVADERPHVAAVFLNRLRRGMRLQSDPTVIYGLGDDAHGRDLTRADLDRPTPYNTYIIAGVPPTPICNPGRAAVLAVLHPAPSDDLYFVANGTGGHTFAASLEDHARNVARWRQQNRDKGAPP